MSSQEFDIMDLRNLIKDAVKAAIKEDRSQRYITVAEAAYKLHTTPQTISRRVRCGEFSSVIKEKGRPTLILESEVLFNK